jgi:hypothetical protein
MATKPKAKPKPKAKAKAKPKPNPLYQPTTVLSGSALKSAATQTVNAELNPQIAALNTQRRQGAAQADATVGRADDYYRQIAAREAQQMADVQGLGANLRAETQGAGMRSAAALIGTDQQVAAAQARDAALRGGQAMLGTSVTDTAAASQRNASTQAMLQSAGERTAASQAANFEGLAALSSQARQARGGELHSQLINRGLNNDKRLSDAITALEATRGAKTTDQLLKLRQQQFENRALLEGLGIKAADVQATTNAAAQRSADARAARKEAARQKSLDRAQQRALTAATLKVKAGYDPVTGKKRKKGQSPAAALDQWKLDYARKHGRLPSTSAPAVPASKKPLTAAEKRARQKAASAASSQFDSALGMVNAPNRIVTDKKTGKTAPASTEQTKAAMRKAGSPEWAIQAAISIRHHGFIIPSVWNMMKRSAPQVLSSIPARYRPGSRINAPTSSLAGTTGR